jgi:hypothetical protein
MYYPILNMLTISQRIPLFLTVCIGSRLAFSYIASFVKGKYATVFSAILATMGMGFLVIYFGGLRKTGAEAGGKIWWNHMRPFHGTMYLIAAKSLLLGYNAISSNAIFIDTMVGLIVFLHHHFIWI